MLIGEFVKNFSMVFAAVTQAEESRFAH